MNACLFLDRDGVINADKVDYVYDVKDLKILPGVPETIQKAKSNGMFVVVITNQSGIDKGIYTWDSVDRVHQAIQEACNFSIDAFYVSPFFSGMTESLGRKPGSLNFERAIARFQIDPKRSYMVGDRLRDLIPAEKLGITTILITDNLYNESFDGNKALNLEDAYQQFIAL